MEIVVDLERFARKWSLTSTVFDYLYRNCTKCLRNVRLPIINDPLVAVRREDNRDANNRGSVWFLERFLWRFGEEEPQSVEMYTVFYTVYPREGLVSYYRRIPYPLDLLFCPQMQTVTGLERDDDYPRITNEEVRESIRVLDTVTNRVDHLKTQLDIHRQRRNEKLARLGRKTILIDLIDRQHGRVMRDIDLITVVNSVITDGFDMVPKQFRN